MTDQLTPMRSMFEVQRTTLHQGNRAVEFGAMFNRQSGDTMMHGLKAGFNLQRQGVETVQAMTHSLFDVIEGTLPGDATGLVTTREAYDEMIGSTIKQHEEFAEIAESSTAEGIEVAVEMSDQTAELLSEQFTQFLAAHEEFESQSTEAVEAFFRQFETAIDTSRDVIDPE